MNRPPFVRPADDPARMAGFFPRQLPLVAAASAAGCSWLDLQPSTLTAHSITPVVLAQVRVVVPSCSGNMIWRRDARTRYNPGRHEKSEMISIHYDQLHYSLCARGKETTHND